MCTSGAVLTCRMVRPRCCAGDTGAEGCRGPITLCPRNPITLCLRNLITLRPRSLNTLYRPMPSLHQRPSSYYINSYIVPPLLFQSPYQPTQALCQYPVVLRTRYRHCPTATSATPGTTMLPLCGARYSHGLCWYQEALQKHVQQLQVDEPI
eukprot:3934738-Rhodomonas_salina.1